MSKEQPMNGPRKKQRSLVQKADEPLKEEEEETTFARGVMDLPSELFASLIAADLALKYGGVCPVKVEVRSNSVIMASREIHLSVPGQERVVLTQEPKGPGLFDKLDEIYEECRYAVFLLLDENEDEI